MGERVAGIAPAGKPTKEQEIIAELQAELEKGKKNLSASERREHDLEKKLDEKEQEYQARQSAGGEVQVTLQSTQAGKPRVAYPIIKRLLIHTTIAMNPTNLF